jgi:hypothetical protein
MTLPERQPLVAAVQLTLKYFQTPNFVQVQREGERPEHAQAVPLRELSQEALAGLLAAYVEEVCAKAKRRPPMLVWPEREA